MPYLNLDLDYFDHPKTKRLVGVLGRGADILPVRLWCYCGKYHADSGNLTGYSPTDLESLIGWWGQPGRALDALLMPFQGKPGFLECIESGYKVHDWEEINGHISALKEKAKAAAKARWEKYRNAQAMPEHSSSNAPGYAPNKDGKARIDLEGKEEGGPGEEGREALRDALVSAFGLNPVSVDEHERIADAVAFLAAKGAKPADISDRLARYRKAWPGAADTLPALLKWWDRFAPPAPKAAKESAEAREAREKREAEEAAWLAMDADEQERILTSARRELHSKLGIR